ncbi:MAG TPA: hypothetical protein VLD62_09995, partial [Acidimicrobiia bacterium]|nr:hypothetical protein [Acidimicrobiia bacterium]
MRRLASFAVAMLLAAAGCADDTSEAPAPTVADPTTSSTLPPPPPIPAAASSLDTQPPSGNRIYAGSGAVTGVEPVDVELGGVG